MRKIHLRWYLTPVRISHMSPASSRLCWRQCGQVGSLLHMWWSCPVISTFWSSVADLVTELTNFNLSLSPELAILDLSINNIPWHFRTIIHHIFLAARITIARHWKETTSPPLEELIRRLNFTCHGELTLSPFTPSPSTKADLWSYWTQSQYFT